MRVYLLFNAQLRFTMNWKLKEYCFGVVVIYTIATIKCHSESTEPVGYSPRSENPGVNDDMESALTTETFAAKPRERRQPLDSRKIRPELIKTLGEASTFTPKPMMESSMDRYQKNPSVYFNADCSKGAVKHIVYGRFDFTGPDVQAQTRGELQPVVECAYDSMTLTLRRTRAMHLRVSTGNDSSLALFKLPPQCGFSIHKSFREISLVARYNGCLVTVQNSRYVLPLLWRRTPVRMSCPVSPKTSQALDGLSLCCSRSGLSISIQGPSVFKQPNVNVRGEWTPLLELVQHCGYSLKRENAQTVIIVPFFACGITSRGGNRTLFLQIGEDVFLLTCLSSRTEGSHRSNKVSQSITTTKTKPVSNSLKPSQWSPPFYLAPPHYPHPSHYHRAQVPGDTRMTPTTTHALPLKIPLQDEQNDYIRPPEAYYNMQTSMEESSQVFPELKATSPLKPHPAPPKSSSPSMQPHNYVFNPYYHYYHLPKIPQTNGPLDHGSAVESQHSDNRPLFYFNSATGPYTKPPPLPYNVFLHHYIQEKINLGEFQKPMHSTPEVHKEYTMETNNLRINPNTWSDMNDQRAFVPVAPAVESRPSANQHSSLYMYYPLPYNYYQLYSGPQSEKPFVTASVPPPQQNENPIVPSKDVQHGFGSDFQKPDIPEQFAPAHDSAEGPKNERESTPHSDLSHLDSRWEEWFNQAAPVNHIDVSSLMPVPEENPHVDDSVQGDHTSASTAPPFAAPSCPGIGSHFHCSISLGCSALPVKDCILGEYLLFFLPEFVIEPKVSGPDHNGEVSCVIGHLTSNPHLYFVPLKDCGVTKRVIDALIVYQLELETCVSDNFLIRMMVECSFYPGFLGAETLFILDPLPPQYTAAVPVQIRIATDESLSFQPEAHLPLSSLRGRLVYMELSLNLPPDPSVTLWVHYCLAYTLTPYTSTTLVYDGCHSTGNSQNIPSVNPNTQYIVVTSFLSFTSPSLLVMDDVDPEVYFFCLTEVCSALHGVCFVGCINRPE